MVTTPGGRKGRKLASSSLGQAAASNPMGERADNDSALGASTPHLPAGMLILPRDSSHIALATAGHV